MPSASIKFERGVLLCTWTAIVKEVSSLRLYVVTDISQFLQYWKEVNIV